MQMHSNRKFLSTMWIAIFVSGFFFINQAKGQEQLEEFQRATQETFERTRIVISTTGSAKFKSYWLDNPNRLVIEFQSRNVVAKIDDEVIVNQGVIKKITSSYFTKGRIKSLKTLTFELSQEVPYRIWQTDNAIVLDIETPSEVVILTEEGVPVEGREIFVKSETGDVILRRLQAMDMSLMEIAETKEDDVRSEGRQLPLELPEEALETEEAIEIGKGIGQVKTGVALPKTSLESKIPPVAALPVAEPSKIKKGMMSILIWPVLALISGFGFLIWRRSNTKKKIKRLNLELQEKNKHLEQEEAIRKAVEQTSIQKEKEYQQLKSELQGKEFSVKTLQEESLRKAKVHEELEHSFESLKNVLVKKGLVKELSSTKEKGKLWISGESPERRQASRLALTQDYNKTIILRIESQNIPEKIKSFANNISSDGLCFKIKKEFKEGELLNLRLFFYGDKVPILKAQAMIVWKKTVGQDNYYGVFFDLLDEKDKLELNCYIESKL